MKEEGRWTGRGRDKAEEGAPPRGRRGQKAKTSSASSGTRCVKADAELCVKLLKRCKRSAPGLSICHPYCAWKKGSVERHNRLLRTCHPNPTDFSKLSPRILRETHRLIVHYPRSSRKAP